MHNYEPKDYNCPFCRLARGENDDINKQEYIVFEDKNTFAYVSPKWWVRNPGSVLVIPKKHTENLYDMPNELLGDVYSTAKKVAIAIRESYPSEGTSTRQHNEPAGDQDVWHFHVHVFPRYEGDELYKNHDQREWVDHEKRKVFSDKLKNYFASKK